MKRKNRRRQELRNRVNARRRRFLRAEALERRLCLASVGWDGPGQGAAEIGYYIGDVPSAVGLEQAEVAGAVEQVLNAWSDVVDVTFVETNLPNQRDTIDIEFVTIDGRGGTLAQAYLPDDVNRGRVAGDIQLDAGDSWEIGNGLGRAAFDVVRVMAHEIGHALGIDHVSAFGSVMFPSVSASQTFSTLSAADVDAALALYAAADAATTSGEPDLTMDDPPAEDITNEDPPTDEETSTDGELDDDDRGRRAPGRRGPRGDWWGRFAAWRRNNRRGGDDTAAPQADTLTEFMPFHNHMQAADVNGDDNVSALDALVVINELNNKGSRGLYLSTGEDVNQLAMIDVNGDEQLSAVDALMVINKLNNTALGVTDSTDPPTDDTIVTDAADPGTEVPAPDAAAPEEPSPDTPDPNAPMPEEPSPGTPDPDAPVAEESAEEPDTAEDNAAEDNAAEEDAAEEDVAEDDDTEDDDTEDDEHTVDDGPLGEGENDCPRGGGIFAHFDANEDGLLTVDEVPEQLWQRLSQADTDADGVVTQDELAEADLERPHRRPHGHRHHGSPFERFDANEDGSLTVDEVPEKAWERISQADANTDGAVTVEELDAYRASKRQ